MTELRLRQARPGEINIILAIDNAASTLYIEAGLEFQFSEDHPFVVAEGSRWDEAIALGSAFVAVDARNRIVGFAVLGLVDEAPYLDQISVHPNAMRQGVGAALLERATLWSDGRPLWLTTYSHLPWNRPYYERHGFQSVDESNCGAELREILAIQRDVLPDPEARIAMVCLET